MPKGNSSRSGKAPSSIEVPVESPPVEPEADGIYALRLPAKVWATVFEILDKVQRGYPGKARFLDAQIDGARWTAHMASDGSSLVVSCVPDEVRRMVLAQRVRATEQELGSIPASVTVKKPGMLTDEEYQAIKQRSDELKERRAKAEETLAAVRKELAAVSSATYIRLDPQSWKKQMRFDVVLKEGMVLVEDGGMSMVVEASSE